MDFNLNTNLQLSLQDVRRIIVIRRTVSWHLDMQFYEFNSFSVKISIVNVTVHTRKRKSNLSPG